MGPIIRFRGYALAVLAFSLAGCGSGDTGGTIPVGPGAGSTSGGGKTNVPDGSTGSSAGGTHGGAGGKASGGQSQNGGAGGDTTGSGGASIDGGSGGTSSDASAGGAGDGGSGGTGGAGNGGAASGGTAGAGNGGAASGGTAGAGNGGAASGGTTSAGGAGAGGATATGCSGVTCDPAATCKGTPNKCVCPAGYTDKNGNGTVCLAPNGGSCSKDAQCANNHCVGGSCCAVACTTPGSCEQAAGTVCANGTTCQYGKKLDGAACDDGNVCTTTSCFNGSCSVDTTNSCDDGSVCTTDSCDSVTGCTHVALDCNDGNPCTTDTCSPTLGCQNAPNTASCDDGNKCTLNDKCSGGSCGGTPKDCSSLTTTCSTGACAVATGNCVAKAKNAGGACTDGLDACDVTGTCQGTSCVSGGPACSAIATSCAPCSSGASCFGAPTGRLCTCPATSGGAPVVLQNGQCVLNTDECATNPCGALATSCKDPTPSAAPSGDYVCTCPAGTTGNKTGSPCVDLDECGAGDPCGIKATIPRATKCTNLTPAQGRYDCTCVAPTFARIPTIAPTASLPNGSAPVCSCNMAGTFAETDTTMVKWSGIGGGIITDSPAAGVPTYGWALRQQTVATDGTMTVASVPCGGVAPTLCDTTNHAYAQYQPVSSWGLPRMRSGMVPIGPVSLVSTIPTAAGTYAEPNTPAILGLDLKDPAGAWPPCRACIGPAVTSCVCGGTTYPITNTATWWSNAEGTNKLGVTTLAVGTAGETIGDGLLPDPPVNYAAASECPRGTGGAPYSAWPGIAGFLDIFSTNQWYGASRVISGRAATAIAVDSSNSCVISGNVTGPDTGNKPHSDARVAGCQKANPAGACSQSGPDEVGFYDNVTQSQQIVSSTFIIQRAPGSINLATLLAMPESTAKDNAISAACETVRTNTCLPKATPSSPANTPPAWNTVAGKSCN